MYRLIVAALLATFAALPAKAQLYAGKTITIITSMGPGGGNDLTARILARYMPRYLPGHPTIVVENMPGGGNVVATNYLYNIAPRDGTRIGLVNNAIPLNQVLGGNSVRYDSRKFNWIGSPVGGVNAIFIMASAGIKKMQDLLTKTVVMGGLGASSSNVVWPIVMDHVLGTKFKVVPGYQNGPDLWLAMERGETQGRTGSYSDLYAQRPDWIRDKKVDFVAQLGDVADKMLPGVPFISGLAKTDEQRQILKFIFSPISLGQPYLAPPDTPPAELALLRQAFAATMKDPDFVADNAKLHIDIGPISAAEITKVVDETIAAPPAIVAKAKAAMVLPGTKG